MDTPLASLPATACSRLLLKQLALCGIHTRHAVIQQNGITPPGVTTTAFHKLCDFLRASEPIFSPASGVSGISGISTAPFLVPPSGAMTQSHHQATPMASATVAGRSSTLTAYPTSNTSPCVSITDHTWWGKRVHYIYRTRQTIRTDTGVTTVRIKRRLYRGVLGELCVNDRGVVVYVKDSVTGLVQK